MAVKASEVAGVADLVQRVLEISTANGGAPMWFRGSRCDQQVLYPSLLRDGKTSKEIFDREARLLARFRQRSMAYWPDGYRQNAWEHLFAMQHFGIPTRLLDWSENALFAAFFAVRGAASHDWHEGPCRPVVWCVDPVRWNQATPPLTEFGDQIGVLTTADDELTPYAPDWNKKRRATPVALYGAHNSERILAQRGNFFAWGKRPADLATFADELSTQPLLWKISLTEGPDVSASDLAGLGFTETMLFPDMPTLASELKMAVEWREVADDES